MSSSPAPTPTGDKTVDLIFNGLSVRYRNLPAVALMVIGFLVAATGLVYGSVTADQGHEETIRITATTGEFPQASGYRVKGASYTVQGLLEDGTLVTQVVDEGQYNSGYFEVWTRHNPGQAPELGTSLLPAQLPHRDAARQIMAIGVVLFALGAVWRIINAVITRRRKPRGS